ncbi:hypothetical protein SPOG_04509 [Schizosaccharomyces cryophilus OY26]|uniref:Uncharacterized protein n=1 Tax=Schizosaccharomyces cryophilus (strain OY26 / ATCC MYA-4695 / CBS 11777 / NBRC 106824 / NRRL Y48691) TaxID=653667 RepID=S9W4P0_SCHCR|nr:uncharacterized protein SPOG_04509 [Schizosaccharomyces cryophilus OY26]EPY53489.1 hypothetical protein SPOG_04509 [Schizosaccharomyces cryophilus OY26]
MQEESVKLDFFLSFSPVTEHELNFLNTYFSQSNQIKLYYGESFYVNIVLSKPSQEKFDQAFEEFNIEGNLYNNTPNNHSNLATSIRKTRAFSFTTKDLTALNWSDGEKDYRLFSRLIKLDTFSLPDHKLEIYVDNADSQQISDQSLLKAEGDATGDISSYIGNDGNDDYITDVDVDFNILGSLSNDARFQSNPPLLPASYISGNIQLEDLKSKPNHISKKRYFNCAIPVMVKLRSYMIDEITQYITFILAPDSSCHSFILKNFTPKSTSSSLALFGPKSADGFNATLTSPDLFSIIYQLKLQPSAYRIEIDCFCEGTIVRKLNGAYVKGMPFVYKHPSMFIMRKSNLHKHSKQVSSSGSTTTPTALLNLLDMSASAPSYVKVGTAFPVGINLYNPSDVPMELLIQVPLYTYDELFITDDGSNHAKTNDGLPSFPPTKPEQIIKLPGLIASTTSFHTGIVSPKCEKDFELQFLAYRTGSYDLSSITVEDIHRHVHNPRKVSDGLQIIVES